MQKRRRVAIVGNSLLMVGLEASLLGREALQVMHVGGGQQGLAAQLATLRPDVVVFDLDAPEAHLLLELVKACPSFPLLGLGSAGNAALAFSSQAHAARSAGDLVELIEREIGWLETRPGGTEGTRGN